MPCTAIEKFRRDRGGAIAVLFGFSAAALMLMVGVAVDSARVYSASDKVRSSLDAAALAGAKLLDDPTSTDADVTSRAKAYFLSHASRFDGYGVDPSSFVTKIDRATGTVVVSIDVAYKSAFGALLSTPLVNFRPEATVIYKTKKIELALVLDITGSMDDDGKISALRNAARNLVETLYSNNPTSGAVRVSVVPYSASVNVGAAYYTAATDAAIASDTCVVNRKTMPGAIVDDPPGPSRWIGTSSAVDNGEYSCPIQQLMPLQDLGNSTERQSVLDLVDNLTADGMTAGHIGLSWGWYTISQNWSSFWPAGSRPKPKSPDVLKAVLLMTDGMFNTSYFAPNGGDNGSDPTPPHSSGALALGMCEEARNAGVAIYTVGFDAPAAAASLLQTCAGSSENAFTAESPSELADRFREIGDRLSMLRLLK